MRILQSLYDAGGGVPPQLAITQLLVDRGHEVMVLAHETLGERVEHRGARFTPFQRTLPGHDMTRRETDLVRDWEPADPIEGAERFRDLVLFGPALDNVQDVLEVIERWPADAIVLDWLLFGTALAAQKARVPSVALVHCPYPLRTDGASDPFFAPGLATMNAARAELGLAPLLHWDQQLLNVDAVFMLTAPELDPGAALDLPDNVRYVGPAHEPAVAEWASPWSASNENPLVIISFSTTFMDQRHLASRALAAVTELPVHTLLTTGPALTLEGVDIPSNVCVSAFAPHSAVLPRAALVITHAGFGTIQSALSAGVPLVCIPTARDQLANAARIAELELGVSLQPAASAAEIRAAIDTALKTNDSPRTLRSCQRRSTATTAPPLSSTT